MTPKKGKQDLQKIVTDKQIKVTKVTGNEHKELMKILYPSDKSKKVSR